MKCLIDQLLKVVCTSLKSYHDERFIGGGNQCRVVGQDLRTVNHRPSAIVEAVAKDEYLAVGYFLKGIVNYKLNRLQDASKDFEAAYTNLRGRNVIDYNQLGLKYKLFDYEPLYNSGVVWGRLGNRPKALECLLQAQKSTNDTKKLNIDQAIVAADKCKEVQLLQVPFTDMIFRPPKTKMANLQKKDYLGKAKVISALDNSDKAPGFEAPRKMSQGLLQLDQLPVKQQKSAPSSPIFGRRKSPSPSPRRPSQDTGNTKNAQLEKLIGEAASKLNKPAAQLKVPSQAMLKTSKSDSNLERQGHEGSYGNRSNLPPPPNKPAPKLPGKAFNGHSAGMKSTTEKSPGIATRGSQPPLPNKLPPSLPTSKSRLVTTPPPNKPAPELPSHGRGNPPNKPPPELPGSQTSSTSSKSGHQKVGTKEFNLNQRRVKPLPKLPSEEMRQGSDDHSENGDDSEMYMYAEETNQLAERLEILRQLDRGRGSSSGVVEEEEYTVADSHRENGGVKPSQVKETGRIGGVMTSEAKVQERKPLPPPTNEAPRSGSHSSSKSTPVTNTPTPTIAYNIPPKPPYSAKSMVTVEFNCNGIKPLKFKKGTSLEKLVATACEEFVLEPGSIDLWYKRASDDEFICVENNSEMSDIWSGVKDKLSVWCFSKD